ncbi:poly(A)-specific ribonuclease PARN-like [Polyodon spathula]|uniref:poly(A)-specific ribonuclease PARN-like n=1 Tax=Polyodon spathula TaxID=7913 RepID=UPI001B7E8BAF|nr:poly(A)-specific ribonuclease PARN-like [Polyodon spathula]
MTIQQAFTVNTALLNTVTISNLSSEMSPHPITLPHLLSPSSAVNTSRYAESYRIQTYAEYMESRLEEKRAKRKSSEDSWKELESSSLKVPYTSALPAGSGFNSNNEVAPGKRSMSPIQEELGSSEPEEGEIDRDGTSSWSSAVPARSQTTNKRKKIRTDTGPSPADSTGLFEVPQVW